MQPLSNSPPLQPLCTQDCNDANGRFGFPPGHLAATWPTDDDGGLGAATVSVAAVATAECHPQQQKPLVGFLISESMAQVRFVSGCGHAWCIAVCTFGSMCCLAERLNAYKTTQIVP